MRAVQFIGIGCVVGLIGGLLLGTVFSSGAGIVEEAIFQSIFGLIGGGIIGTVVHILTRSNEPFETFLPSTTTKPTNPWPAAIIVFVLIAIGTTSRLQMLWQSTDSNMDLVIAIATLFWIVIGAFLIRMSFRRYKKKLALYHKTMADKEAMIPAVQVHGSEDAR